MKLQVLALIFFISFAGIAQVGIGTTMPDGSAALDVVATDKGFLMPRMTTVQKDAIATPAAGLQVYDMDTKSVWVYDGTVWKESSGGGKFVDGAAADIAYYDGRVGIGRNQFSQVHKLYVENNLNGGQNTLVKFDAIFNGTGTSQPVNGLAALARNTGGGTMEYGIGEQGVVENLSGGTINVAIGSWPDIKNNGTIGWGASITGETRNNSGGTMTEAYGESINIFNQANASIGEATISSLYFENTGSITGDAYGLWIGGASTGTVGGDAYALYVATPFTNVTGNNFALYSGNTANSYMEGNLGVGTSNPQQKVHINGVMRLEPQAAPPTGALGDLYVGTDGKLYFHTGTGGWKEVQLVP